MKRLILAAAFIAACVYYPAQTIGTLRTARKHAVEIGGKVAEVVKAANVEETTTVGEGAEADE